MLVVDIYNNILKALKQNKAASAEQLLHLTTPNHYKDIISVFAKAGIDSSILTKVVATQAKISYYTAKDDNTIVYQDSYCFIIDKTLYLVNPFDEKFKNTMIAAKGKQTNKIDFNQFCVCAYDDIHLVKDISQKKAIEANHNEIEALWQGFVVKTQTLGASDIHFIPEVDTIRIGYRVFTTIRHGLSADLSYPNYKKIVNLLLSKCSINHGVFVRSNSGRFNAENLSFRLETLPTNQHFADSSICPKTTIRIHKAGKAIMSIEQLGLPKKQVDVLQELAAFIGSKLLMISGPTGSGKTTILYAILKEMQKFRSGIMIHTLEDPPEINLPGVVQTHIDRVNKGNTWEEGIQSVLRSDPNIVLIGEIRDANTADCAIELATTGHVALSTIHTDTALGILTRLRSSFKIDNVILAETLHTLMGTRMLQKVCEYCSELKEVQAHKFIGISQNYLQKYIDMGIANFKIKHANNIGCEHCYQGYAGIVPVVEIYRMDAQALLLVANNEPMQTLEKYFNKDAESQINIGFWQGGINLLLDGITTIDQLEHELPVYSDINMIVIPDNFASVV